MIRRPALVLAATALAAVLSACQGGSGTASTASTSPSSAATPPGSGALSGTGAAANTAGGPPPAAEFVRCLRDRGFDVVLQPDGSVVPGNGGPADVTGGPVDSGGPGGASVGSDGRSSTKTTGAPDLKKLDEAKAACAKQVPGYVPPKH